CPIRLALYRYRNQIAAGNNAIDHAVLDGLFGLHDVIAVDIAGDTLDRLPRRIREHRIEDLAHAQDLAGINVDVRGLAGQTLHRWLVDHNARVRQAEALAFRALGQQHGRHRSGLADADGHDVGPDERHRDHLRR